MRLMIWEMLNCNMIKNIILVAIAVLCGLGAVFTLTVVKDAEDSWSKAKTKPVVKHEQHKNVYHCEGKTTEVFSHTIRYGDTMRVEIDTFIYR